MSFYDPNNWYWRKDDGTIYSSKAGGLVASDDAAFIAWKGDGLRGPQIWPRDNEGNQTDESLQEVLEPYGIKVTLKGYAAKLRWEREQRGITVGGHTIATDDRSKNLLLGARVAANNDPSFTTPWSNADGSFTILDAAQVIALSDAVLAHVKDCFTRYETASDGIDAATITTRAEIDSIFEAA